MKVSKVFLDVNYLLVVFLPLSPRIFVSYGLAVGMQSQGMNAQYLLEVTVSWNFLLSINNIIIEVVIFPLMAFYP